MRNLLITATIIMSIAFMSCSKELSTVSVESSKTINEFIKTRYPNAVILEIEYKLSTIEVDILDVKTQRDVVFDRPTEKWLFTETDFSFSQLPQLIQDAFSSSEYSNLHIDDIDFLETPDGNFYRFELEQNDIETIIHIRPDGSIEFISGGGIGGGQGNEITELISQFILDRYPNAVITEIEFENNNYKVEFLHENKEKEAKFDINGNWLLTETDFSFSQLPQLIQDAFSSSEYSNIHIDDIDFLETPDGNFYRFELEQNDIETIIHIHPDGSIELISGGGIGGGQGNEITELISQFILNRYPNAVITEIELDNNKYKVEFIHDNKEKEAKFDINGNWLFTETDFSFYQLPQLIQNAFSSSEYSNIHIDDIDFMETPDGDFYRFELEQNDIETIIHIHPDGSIELISGGGGIGGGQGDEITELISQFILNRYPNAVITDIELDNNNYEVEFRHDNREKDAKFDISGNWLRTEWDLRPNELPQMVVLAIQNSPYSNYTIEDAEFNDNPSTPFYLVELERGNHEIELRITPEGVIL